MIQLDFFPEDDHEIKERVKKVETSMDKVRKGLWSRHGELAKMYFDVHARLEILERSIIQGKNQ